MGRKRWGTLFRGGLQVQVTQKIIKEAKEFLPLAEAQDGGDAGGVHPSMPHLHPFHTPALTTGPRNMCCTKQACGGSSRAAVVKPLAWTVPEGSGMGPGVCSLGAPPSESSWGVGSGLEPGSRGPWARLLVLCEDAMAPSSAKHGPEESWCPGNV